MAKRGFTIDTGSEKIDVEGHEHKNVAVKYLMKRRRRLLFTKDPGKVEKLWTGLPQHIAIIGKQVTKELDVEWEQWSTGVFAGAMINIILERAAWIHVGDVH